LLFRFSFFFALFLDPNYKGFKPIDDDFELPVETILSGRLQFFKEGNHVGKEFLQYVKTIIEEKEETRRENRQTLKRGAIFFVITCVADYLVMAL
jgi:hypothetical protein